MNSEKRNCQNCHKEFSIEPEDLLFYEKIKVPAPTWCPECGLIRRLLFRNEHNLYKKRDALTRQEVISMYAPDSPFKIYDQKTWWSDKWDSTSYGRDYDFSRPFFTQFQELMQDVPWPALINWNAVNSEYCNYCSDNKSCYLEFGSDFNEDCSYGTHVLYSKDTLDSYFVDKMELSYEVSNSENCYRVAFAQQAVDCRESAFLSNCVNCDNCFGCANLRNRSYHIFNQPYSKEEYEKKIQEWDLGSFMKLNRAKEWFLDFKLKQPHRYSEALKAINSTGNNLYNVKNCQRCFDVTSDVEDAKNFLFGGWGAKDIMNSHLVGHKAELVYDSFTVFSGAARVIFSAVVQSSHDIQYSFNVSNGSSNLFGCVGLSNKHYCVLNKQYPKEEYEKLVSKIIQQMQDAPYQDKRGRTYKYGEFFPSEFSPFAYNESKAQDFFPLTKEEALRRGYSWRDAEERRYEITLAHDKLPDHTKDASDSILIEVIGCKHSGTCTEQCTIAFKIIPSELEFYRKMNLPLPRLCPNCRHHQRLKQRNPLKLWHRKCTCGGANSDNGVYQNQVIHFHRSNHCPNEFETSYAPERPEIVYCEQCYQNEVA